MGFSVTVAADGAERVLRAEGELDIASAAELREAGESAFADDGCTTVRLDLAGVDFIDSTGLGVLVGLRNTALSSGKSLVLGDRSATVARLLDLSGLTGVFGG